MTDPASRPEDEVLQALLERYLAACDSGQTITLAELCHDRPDLRGALQELVAIAGELPANDADGPRDALLGTRLCERYTVLDRLGAGAMGLVYLARDESLGREVAVKVLGTPFSSAEHVERFRREARSLASLADPHIVAVHDLHLDAEPPFLVMECVQGIDLRALLDGLRQIAPDRLPTPAEVRACATSLLPVSAGIAAPVFASPWVEQVARLGAQVCRALAAAHAAGVVHRDVKPSNLMLDAAGRLRLLDFGLARREADPAITRSRSSLGTPSYMSPEQVAGAPATPRSDVYSLGATLYECLSLQPPFAGTGRALENRILYDEPAPLRDPARRIPRDLGAICLKALQKTAKRRYASAVEMGDDLERFLRYEPVSANPRTLPRPLRLAIGAFRRYRPPAAVMIGLLVVLSAAVIALGLIFGEKVAAVRGQQVAERLRHDRELAGRLHARLPPTIGLAGTAAERRDDPLRDEHLAALRRIVELDADDVEARFLLARLLEEGAGDEGAVAEHDAWLRHRLGAARWSALRQAFTALRDRAPEVDTAIASLSPIDDVPASARRLWARLSITAALQGDRFGAAAAQTRELVRQTGATSFTLWAETMVQLGLGRRPAQVIDGLTRLLDLCPGDLPTLHSLAKYHRDLGNPKLAARYMDEILAGPRRPAHVAYHRLHALILRDLGRFAEAEQVIEQDFPADAGDERQLALANLAIWRGMTAIDLASQQAFLADAERQLDALDVFLRTASTAGSAAVERMLRAVDTNRRMATVHRTGNKQERIELLLEGLQAEPFNELLLLRLSRDLRLAGAALANAPQVTRGCGELLLAQTLIRDPRNQDAARTLAGSLVDHDPVAALGVVRAHLDPGGEDSDVALIESALAALDPPQRDRWRRSLQETGWLQ